MWYVCSMMCPENKWAVVGRVDELRQAVGQLFHARLYAIKSRRFVAAVSMVVIEFGYFILLEFLCHVGNY